MDTFTPDERSDIMRRVHSAGTRPERIVRKIVRGFGIRFRSCPSSLPGKPDLVIPTERKAILVHGCFWHGHNCPAGKLPKSNRQYWRGKQAKNSMRDSRNARTLRSLGWKEMVIWECQLRNTTRLEKRISEFLKER